MLVFQRMCLNCIEITLLIDWIVKCWIKPAYLYYESYDHVLFWFAMNVKVIGFMQIKFRAICVAPHGVVFVFFHWKYSMYFGHFLKRLFHSHAFALPSYNCKSYIFQWKFNGLTCNLSVLRNSRKSKKSDRIEISKFELTHFALVRWSGNPFHVFKFVHKNY